MYHKVFALEEDVFKVIANQKRLEIIQLLRGRELNVTEMIAMLGLRQANLSQHLSLLRQHKLVTVTKKGREAHYTLTDDNIAKAVQLIYRFLQVQHHIEDVPSDTLFPIVTDPVCGMRISASEAFATAERAGQVYYFCASGCRERFVSHRYGQ
jgi:DNA-binding transcriptional ArsR family regulator/YHS domain-containing protein